MIVRVRLPDGSTRRENIEQENTLYELAAKIYATGLLAAEFQLYSDARWTSPFTDTQATVGSCKIQNGDVIYVKGSMAGADDSDPIDVDALDAAKVEKNSEVAAKRVLTPNCMHGPNGMCSHCAPEEDKSERYQAELAKWKDRKGTSMAVLEAMDAMKFRVQPQKEPSSISAVSVDRSAAAAFQRYLAECHFNQQRFGFLYGNIDDELVARIEAIYEPPQQGDDKKYAPMPAADSGDISERASSVAELLQLKRCGIVFSTKQRKAILSGLDILTAAQAQAEEEAKHGHEHAKQMVVLVVSLSDDNETHFEAYQLSDQCLEMYKAGVFLPADKQKVNSGRIKTQDSVFVEGKEVTSVHTEFFLLTQPIRDHSSWLRTEFPIENRELRPQQQTDIRDTLSRGSDLPFYKRVSDFHLLLFLSNSFDIASDLPGLLDVVRDQREFTSDEEGSKILIESM